MSATDRQILNRMLENHGRCLRDLYLAGELEQWPHCPSGGGRPGTLVRWGLAESVRTQESGRARPRYTLRITERGKRIYEEWSAWPA